MRNPEGGRWAAELSEAHLRESSRISCLLCELEVSGSGRRCSLNRPVGSRGVGEAAGGVAVVMADPGHGEGQRVFVAALGYQVQIAVGADRPLGPARVARVGVEHVAVLVLVERADSRGR